MRPALAVLLAAALGLVLAAPAPAATGFRSCRPVPFTPNSDDVASSVRVRAVGCRTARELIRDSEGRPGRRFRGYRCTRRESEPDLGLAYTQYRCASGERVIRWKRF